MEPTEQPSSPSLGQPDYWWYRARAELLRTILEPHIGDPERVLDVGSADGPSVEWMSARGRRIALDVDFTALKPGDVCGSAHELPFGDATFDVVAAFDVLEHCEPESRALGELIRVLRPGGRLMLAVPAYNWAWTPFDDEIGHFRRYTRPRLLASVEAAGITVDRSTYMFAGTFPMFAAERLLRRAKGKRAQKQDHLPKISPTAEKILLGLCKREQRQLAKRDLPFGSSVVLVGTKPA